jgi:large subunit ribosomal protein L29
MATTAKELLDLSIDDLNRRAGELRDTIFQDTLKLKTGSLDAPTDRMKHKRELARVLTVLTQKNKKAPAKA